MMSWRAHFGMAEDAETVQPVTQAPQSASDNEHSRAIALLLLVMALCCAVLIYGIARGL